MAGHDHHFGGTVFFALARPFGRPFGRLGFWISGCLDIGTSERLDVRTSRHQDVDSNHGRSEPRVSGLVIISKHDISSFSSTTIHSPSEPPMAEPPGPHRGGGSGRNSRRPIGRVERTLVDNESSSSNVPPYPDSTLPLVRGD